MDDRRFDSLAKSLASGASRRSVLKSILGLGGAALAGSVVLDGDSEAARRPANPTPTPVKCPGNQVPSGGACVCPGTAPNKCGPDCCTSVSGGPPIPTHSECCDNACCFGTCTGEEVCCPTNNRGTVQSPLPPTHSICATVDGPECCLFDQACCSVDGCCGTFCYGGPLENSFCCPDAQACPGGTSSDDNCCDAGETCCGGGTNDNYCADLAAGGCCDASDCAPQEGACAMACVAGQCQPTTCSAGNICCQGECVSSSIYVSCPADPDECCNTSLEACCGAGGCCAEELCNPGAGVCCTSGQRPCGSGDNTCCDSPQTCCGGDTCCAPGNCTTAGECCSGDNVFCVNECCPADQCLAGQGCCPEGFVACGGSCCNTAGNFCDDDQQCVCLPGTEPCSLLPGPCCPVGQCNADFFSCAAGTTPCGEVCCDDATQTCSAELICECNGGLLNCNGQCIDAQCCGTDTSTCVLLGFDPECVVCVQGTCSDGGTDFLQCTTDEDGEGFCSNGICEPCLPEGSECTQFQECCNNQGYECSGGFCTS